MSVLRDLEGMLFVFSSYLEQKRPKCSSFCCIPPESQCTGVLSSLGSQALHACLSLSNCTTSRSEVRTPAQSSLAALACQSGRQPSNRSRFPGSCLHVVLLDFCWFTEVASPSFCYAPWQRVCCICELQRSLYVEIYCLSHSDVSIRVKIHPKSQHNFVLFCCIWHINIFHHNPCEMFVLSFFGTVEHTKISHCFSLIA